METKFYLKNPKSRNETPIYARFNFEGRAVKFYFGKKIHPALWEFETKRPTKNKKKIEAFKHVNYSMHVKLANLNIYLNNLEGYVAEYLFKSEISKSEVSSNGLKQFLNEKLELKKSEVTLESKFVAIFYNQIIKKMEEEIILTPHQKKYSRNSIKAYRVSLARLVDFEKNIKRVTFSDVDLTFYNEYINYLQKRGYAQNSIGNDIKNLKVIMERALSFGLHTNINFRDKNFKKICVQSYKIFLKKEEIKRIEKLDLSDTDLSLARDYFLLAYFTGQRISDVIQFSKDNFYLDEFLRFYTCKTGEEMQIPLHKRVLEIFEIHGGYMPKMQPNKINMALKKLGKLAGLEEVVSYQEERGGKTVQIKKRKFEMITTHTARRSTITNLHLDGVDNSSIMALSGHKTEATLNRYIRSSVSDRANKLKKLDFFK